MALSPTSSGKKLISTKGGLRMVYVNDEERSPFEKDESIWQIDSEHLICNKCGTKFAFHIRRHHCRRCGQIYCGSCCSSKVALPRFSYVDPQRVCKDCVPIAKKEEEFYEHHLKSLTNGAQFSIGEDQPMFFTCKLNQKTHRELSFECTTSNKNGSYPDVLMDSITSLQCLTDSTADTSSGATQLVGVVLKFHQNDQQQEIRLMIDNSIADRKESTRFLVVLQKAVKMLFETR